LAVEDVVGGGVFGSDSVRFLVLLGISGLTHHSWLGSANGSRILNHITLPDEILASKEVSDMGLSINKLLIQ
jgi:hypothetical protein